MTEEEDRKPRPDEARYDPEITSEFALPAGIAVPEAGVEPETTSEFAVPKGLATPQPAARPEAARLRAFRREHSSDNTNPAREPRAFAFSICGVKSLRAGLRS